MQTTQKATAAEISPQKLNTLASTILGAYPNPDDPQPPGPWDPVIKGVLERFGPSPDPWHEFAGPDPFPWRQRFTPKLDLLRIIARKYPQVWDVIGGGGRLESVALNPQPLPPREAFVYELAGVAVDRLLLIQETADLIGGDGDRQGIIVVGGRISELVDEFCGTGWPKKFPPKPPGPDPDPRFSAIELLLVASRFLTAAGAVANPQLADELNRAGERLMDEAVNRT